MRRKPQHPLRSNGSCKLAGGANRELQTIRRFVVSNHNHNRDLGRFSKEWKMQCTGSRGESRDTPAPGGEAKVPSYPLEGVRVFQVRQKVTDEGEDHTRSSLSDHRSQRSPPQWLICQDQRRERSRWSSR